MGGYDNSPDYGGPKPNMKWFMVFLLIIIVGILVFIFGTDAKAQSQELKYCSNSKRVTCVVDGDTIWLHGEKLRLKDFDTPEPRTNVCGGNFEKDLAKKASARLMELLNSNHWTMEKFGKDRYGRTLTTIRIDGVDVGDILIKEKLARAWPDGHEFWCK